MSAGLPLIAGFSADAPLAWRSGGRPVTQGQFAAQAQRLACGLPAAPQLINLCEDRYRFMLGLAASALRGVPSLLAASNAAAGTAPLQERYPQAVRLTDADVDDSDAGSVHEIPAIPGAQVVAIAFTSGSTGASQPHPKRWDTLVQTAQLASQRFLAQRACHIVATVPPQHLYGLETTVLMALAAGCTVHAGRPFFPQDVAQALAEVPAPRLLITTPVHLRALVAARPALPDVQLTISATAPLSAELAREAEGVLRGPVHEYFGCTEAGSIASRHTVAGEAWELYGGMRIEASAAGARVSGRHLPEPVLLSDVIEVVDDRHFRVLGRGVDMLKVAGKRGSIGDLTQKLLAIPGVEDGVVFLPDDDAAVRPAALVVAPGLSEAAILDALALAVDPVFLPRPLKRVERLPRNVVGKLPRADLLAALRSTP